jgi:hypothetical protein
MSEIFTFDKFQPGTVLGETVVTFDAVLAQGWQRIFGDAPQDGANDAAEGAGLAVVMMMRAYLGVVTPRPPGNVHSRQRLAMQGVPRQGEAIRTVMRCESKELKRERRYVELRATGTGDGGRPIYDGLLTLIWAA